MWESILISTHKKLYDAKIRQGDLERLDLWQMNLEHVVQHPWFGMGPAGYAVYNMTYHPEDARSDTQQLL